MRAHRRAQAERRWSGDKSHFVWKFTGKMLDPKPRRAISHGNLHEKMPENSAAQFQEDDAYPLVVFQVQQRHLHRKKPRRGANSFF